MGLEDQKAMSQESRLHLIGGSEGPAAIADVVFVHGLGGHWRETWVPMSGEAPAGALGPHMEDGWLDWLAKAVGSVMPVHLWSLEYDATPTNWRGQGVPLIDRASNVLARLSADGIGRRPLAFVAHSLGGLLVKSVLRNSKDALDDENRAIFESTRGVVFFATPHTGASLASFSTQMLRLLGPLGFFARPSSIVEELHRSAPGLRGLNLWYGAQRIRSKIFYETKPVFLWLKVVDEASAAPLLGSDPVAIDADHFQICKLGSEGDLAFKHTRQFLLDCFQRRPLALANAVGAPETAAFSVPRVEWTKPPRPARVFGRMEETKDVIAALLSYKPALVLGGPGIGKTTLTLAASSDPEIEAKFGDRRCFVRLETANDSGSIVLLLAASLGLSPSADPWPAAAVTLAHSPALVILDNLETPWERDQAGTEELLARLAGIRQVTVLCSLRGGQAPLNPKWGACLELPRLREPYDRDLLLDIAGDGKRHDRLLGDVLAALDGVPLAIELFAAEAAAHETLEISWSRWKRERTRMLKRGRGDSRTTSLDVSIAFSMASPRMTPAARRLFAMMGRLPDGMARNALGYLFGGNGLEAAAALVAMRLAFERKDRLRMLEPIRAAASSSDLAAGDLDRMFEHYFASALELPKVASTSARAELSNIEGLLELTIREANERKTPGQSLAWLRQLAVLSGHAGDARATLGFLRLAEQNHLRSHKLFLVITAADPSNVQWQRDLFVNFNKIGDVRLSEGDRVGALRAFQDGLDIAKHLSESDPSKLQWQRDLCVSFNRIGDVRLSEGDRVGALRAFQDGLDIAKRLSESDPSNVLWQRDLSVSFDRIGDLRLSEGDRASALCAFQNGLDIAKRLAESDPNNVEWQRDLSVSFDRIGDLRLSEGDRVGALRAFQNGLDIAKRLCESDPNNVKWQRDLSVSFNKMGNVRLSEGDRVGALRAFQDCLDIRNRLAESDPNNVEWQRDLSVSFNRIGDLRLSEGDRVGALRAFQNGLDIAKRLAESDPSNLQWQRDLSVSFNKMGDVRLSEGDRVGALRAFQDFRDIAKRLCESDPNNVEWRRDLSISFDRMGDVRLSEGDRVGALRAFQDGLDIRKRLAESDPSNVQWQRDLSVSFNRIGDVRLSEGDRVGALRAFQDGLDITKSLAESDPSNVQWQRDLSFSFDRIGDMRLSEGDRVAALRAFQDGLDITKRLAESDPSNVQWQRDLSVSHANIAKARPGLHNPPSESS